MSHTHTTPHTLVISISKQNATACALAKCKRTHKRNIEVNEFRLGVSILARLYFIEMDRSCFGTCLSTEGRLCSCSSHYFFAQASFIKITDAPDRPNRFRIHIDAMFLVCIESRCEYEQRTHIHTLCIQIVVVIPKNHTFSIYSLREQYQREMLVLVKKITTTTAVAYPAPITLPSAGCYSSP